MPTLDLDPVVDRVRDAVRDVKRTDLDIDVQAIADDIRTEMTRRQQDLGKHAKTAGRELRKELAKVDTERLPLPDPIKDAVRDALPRERRWPGRLLLLAGVVGLAAALLPEVRRRVRMAAQAAYELINDLMAGAERREAVAFPAADAIQVNGDPWAQDALAPLPEGLGATQTQDLAPGAGRDAEEIR